MKLLTVKTKIRVSGETLKVMNDVIIDCIKNREPIVYNSAEYELEVLEFDDIQLEEIIHCRDCEYYHKSGYCKCIGQSLNKLPSDFCSYAIRRY